MKNDLRIKKEYEEFAKTVPFILFVVIKIDRQSGPLGRQLSSLEGLYLWSQGYRL